MPVTGPAGILAFYILSACGYSGLFYRHKSLYAGFPGFDVIKYVVIPAFSILAFLLVKYLCQVLLKGKPIFPAEQIVMDVKRMNINFTLVGPDNK